VRYTLERWGIVICQQCCSFILPRYVCIVECNFVISAAHEWQRQGTVLSKISCERRGDERLQSGGSFVVKNAGILKRSSLSGKFRRTSSVAQRSVGSRKMREKAGRRRWRFRVFLYKQTSRKTALTLYIRSLAPSSTSMIILSLIYLTFL